MCRYTDFPEDDTECQNQSTFQKLDTGSETRLSMPISISCALRNIVHLYFMQKTQSGKSKLEILVYQKLKIP